MPDITSANVAQAIVKLVAAQGLPYLIANLRIGNLINRDFEPMLASAGDTVNIPIPGTYVANNIIEGGTVQTQNPSLGNAQLVLNQHLEVTFQIPDVTKALASVDVFQMSVGPAMAALATQVETLVLSQWAGFTSNAPLGATSAMDEARIDAAETALFTALVPPNEPKFLFVAPTAFASMRQISRFTEYQTIGAQGVMGGADLPGAGPLGANGMIKSFLVFRSQLVPTSTNFKNLAFHKNAIGLVMRRLPQPLPGTGAIAEYAEMAGYGMRITMSYHPDTLAQQFTIDCLCGTGILRNSHGQVIQST
jgi:hypothetical protein